MSTEAAAATGDKLIHDYPMIPRPAVSTIHAALDRNGLVKRRKRRRYKASGTPLTEALYAAGHYFRSRTPSDPFATWFGADTVMGIPAKFVQVRLNAIVEDPFGAGTCLILVGAFFATKLYRQNLLTIGDFYRQRYGVQRAVLPRVVAAEYARRNADINRLNALWARNVMADGSGWTRDGRIAQEALARQVGCSPDEICVTRSGSDALQLLIRGYNRLKAGEAAHAGH